MILIGSADVGPEKYLACIRNINLKKKLIFINKKNFYKLKKINFEKIKLIITGTSLGSSIDKNLVKLGKKKNIMTISVIEHWTNFQSRFKLDKKNYFPDRIFVNDKFALNIAIKNKLPKKLIDIAGNLRLEQVEKSKLKKLSNWAAAIKKKYKKIILFISEPIKNDKKYLSTDYRCDEIFTLKKIINQIDAQTLLIIKVHPNEKLEKFSKFKKKTLL